MAAKKWYRYYNPLIDLVFWLWSLTLLHSILRVLGILSQPLGGAPQAIRVVYLAVMLAAWFLAIFLVCARFMRDEYAERLWQQAAAKFVVVLVLGSFVLGNLETLFRGWLAENFKESFIMQVSGYDTQHRYPGHDEMQAIIAVFSNIAIHCPYLFILLYKWQRWRDRA